MNTSSKRASARGTVSVYTERRDTLSLPMRLHGVVLVAALLCSTSVRAEIDSPHVRGGVAAYEALDFRRAVSLLESARKQRLTVEELTLTLRTLASARVALGDEAAARADFVALLEIAPDYTLDRTVSPRIRAVFDQARAQMPERPPPPPVVTPPPAPPPIAIEAPPPPPPKKKPVYKRGWFWGVIGGVAGAAIVAGVLAGVLTRPSDGTLVVSPHL
jgi:hypothetical protein